MLGTILLDTLGLFFIVVTAFIIGEAMLREHPMGNLHEGAKTIKDHILCTFFGFCVQVAVVVFSYVVYVNAMVLIGG